MGGGYDMEDPFGVLTRRKVGWLGVIDEWFIAYIQLFIKHTYTSFKNIHFYLQIRQITEDYPPLPSPHHIFHTNLNLPTSNPIYPPRNSTHSILYKFGKSITHALLIKFDPTCTPIGSCSRRREGGGMGGAGGTR